MKKVALMLSLAVVVSLMSLATVFAAEECKDKPKDIVDTAVSAGSFKTLAAALTAADLVENAEGRRAVHRLRPD